MALAHSLSEGQTREDHFQRSSTSVTARLIAIPRTSVARGMGRCRSHGGEQVRQARQKQPEPPGQSDDEVPSN